MQNRIQQERAASGSGSSSRRANPSRTQIIQAYGNPPKESTKQVTEEWGRVLTFLDKILEPKDVAGLDNLIGLDTVKAKLETDLFMPLKVQSHPNPAIRAELAKIYPAGNGILMYGPPGTGKSYTAKCLAAEGNKTGIKTLSINGNMLKGEFLNTSTLIVAALMKAVNFISKQTGGNPVILFIDEIDSVF